MYSRSALSSASINPLNKVILEKQIQSFIPIAFNQGTEILKGVIKMKQAAGLVTAGSLLEKMSSK